MVGIAAPGARRLLLASGDQGWAQRWLLSQLQVDDLAATLWVADRAPPGVSATPAGQVAQHLGSECRLLVFNAHCGFHPDAFAAAVGTLRGGGDCVLLAPPLEAWPLLEDPDKARFTAYPRTADTMQGYFLARLVRRWVGHPATHVVTPQSCNGIRVQLAPTAAAFLRLSDQQELAVAAVERAAHGHARRPLVLTADRGRGKSTVLGVAAARLLLTGLPRVTVVAPHRAAAETLFRHALASAGLAPHAPADLALGGGSLRFRLPADCLAGPFDEPGLVLVDEAAAVPVGVLSELLEHANRLVFASTVHGYEGSGRGFDIRFRALLDRRMPQWRAMRLENPVRWAPGDPLEALLNDAFVLDAELAEADSDRPVSVERIEPALLAGQERLLRGAFGLLINAHYQTRPSDLRQLLDNPDVELWLARQGEVVVGVLLACAEGGFDAPMAERVLAGRRRPRGHLLPQSLAVHAGLDEMLVQRSLRVQRIAVHPDLRRCGLGRRLLEGCAGWAVERHFDLLGCAFAADPGLLAFWRGAGFSAARLGTRVDPASAAHSLFMLRGLSMRGRALADLAARRFLADLPWALGAELALLDSQLAVALLHGRGCDDLRLDAADRRDLGRVAAGARLPATAASLTWKALVQIAAQGATDSERLAPLVAWLLQHQAAERVCGQYALEGQRDLVARLRGLLALHHSALPSNG